MALRSATRKPIVGEEVGDAGEEADGHHGVLGGLVDEGAEELAAGADAFGFGLDDDGADFGEVWAVEVEGAAAEEVGGAVGLDDVGDGEVADVLADLGVGAAEEGAVGGERVDEVEDLEGVLDAGFVDADVLRGRREASRGGVHARTARFLLWLMRFGGRGR